MTNKVLDIKYSMGDKIKFNDPQWDEEEDSYIPVVREGYIFTIQIGMEQGYVSKKKGHKVRYKVHHDFEGMHGGWRYVWEGNVVKKTGEHPHKNNYSTKI